MAWATFLLTALSAHVGLAVQPGIWNAGECTGKVVNAAAHLAGAGLQITVATKHCVEEGKEGRNEARCAFDVTVAMRSLWRATRLLTQASGSCGGNASSCGVAIANSAGFLSGSGKYATETYIDYNGKDLDKARKDLELMSLAINQATRSMTDAATACKDGSIPNTAKNTGYCVAEILSAATTASAASMETIAAQAACKSDDKAMCAATASATSMDLMNVAVHLTKAAKECGATSTACALDIEQVLMYASAASAMGAKAAVANKEADMDDVRDKVTLAGESTAAMVKHMAHAATTCSPNNGNPGAAGLGKCLGDSISAATYLADGALEISIAVKNCAKVTDGGKIDKCASDVMHSMEAFAKTATELLRAADNCETGSTFSADCGTDITGALDALMHAGRLSAKLNERDGPRYDAEGRGARGQDLEESIGDKFEAFAAAMDKATKQCKRTTSAALSALYTEVQPSADSALGSKLPTAVLIAVVASTVIGTVGFLLRKNIHKRRAGAVPLHDGPLDEALEDVE